MDLRRQEEINEENNQSLMSLSTKMVDMEQVLRCLSDNVMNLIHHQMLHVDSLEVECGCL
jgi:hypothetical protein